MNLLTTAWTRFSLTIVTAALLLLTSSFPTTVRAQAPNVLSDRNGIVVQGSGEVTIKPDIARLTLGVRTESPTSQVAAQTNATRTDAVVKALRAAGIAENDVQTVNYSVMPQIQYPGQQGGTPKTTGYVVENTVRVIVRKLPDAGSVLDAALKAGANLAGGIQFDANDANRAKAQEEALTKAVAAAQQKAVTLAKAAKAGRITLKSVMEETAEPIRPMYAGAMMARAEATTTPVQPGEMTIRASVTLRYDFNPDLAANY
jgi:uncharacterized protein